ncbi:MAG: DNA-binding protein [Thermoplasmatales archaeon]|nr:MAG: DNA-binding protein [Thermoplasmatales archaeon]
MDEELEKLRKKKLQELQQQAALQENLEEQEEQKKQYDEQKKAILRSILTTEARERLGRIKIARPEIVESIENQLIMLAQSGQLKSKITDQELLILLQKIIPKKRDIKIKRR